MIRLAGPHCYSRVSLLTAPICRSAGCLDAGTPVKVGKGCHKLSDFKDAKAIKCLKH